MVRGGKQLLLETKCQQESQVSKVHFPTKRKKGEKEG